MCIRKKKQNEADGTGETEKKRKKVNCMYIIMYIIMLIICFGLFITTGVRNIFKGIESPFSHEESTILVAWIISYAIIIITLLICISTIVYRIVSEEKTNNELTEKNNTLKQIYESVFKEKKK